VRCGDAWSFAHRVVLSGGEPAARAVVEVRYFDEDGQCVAVGRGTEGETLIPSPRLWRPGDAYLYTAKVRVLSEDGALLDLGDGDAAFEIARRALDVWKAEVEASWNCFEHFIVETGRGAGWHQFSGLSCPVLAWFAAYYGQNRITVGHHATITSRQDFDGRTLRFSVLFDDHPPAPEMTAIVTLPPGGSPSATCNGKPVPLTERHPGCIELRIPTSADAEVMVARE
jgi:hypothetical protein